MGIAKLWKKLERIVQNDVKLSSFRDKRVALDFSIIIHTAAYGFTSSKQNYNLLTNHGRMIDAEKTEEQLEKEEKERIDQYIHQCVDHALEKVYHMIQQGVQLLVVLDGTTPPIKRQTTAGRRERQETATNYLREDDSAAPTSAADIPLPSFEEFANSQSSLQELDDMANDGNTTLDDGPVMSFSEHKDGGAPVFEYVKGDEERKKKFQALRKAGATPMEFAQIKHMLINKFREFKIPFLVSPYEADSQLAYLANTFADEEKKELGRLVDLVISSDSDCVPLGIPKVLAKIQIDHKEDNCFGLLYEKADIPNLPDDYNFNGFTEGAIACACILSGCDYLKNLPQMGIVKARHIVERSFRPWLEAKDRTSLPAPLATLHHNLSNTSMMARLPPFERRMFWNGFLRSLLMFRHPVVFDPLTQEHIIVDREDPELTCYEPYAKMVDDDDIVQAICGELLPDVVARGITEGWINPKRLTLYKEDKFGEFVQGDTPDDIKKGYDEWVSGGGLEKIMAIRKERGEKREAELQKIIKEGEEDERKELEEYQKEEDEREKDRRKNGGVVKMRKKIYVYTNKEMEIKERFVKLYEKFAPEKLSKVDKIMGKYKDNLVDAIEAAEEKYGATLSASTKELKEEVEDEIEESEELISTSPNKRKAVSYAKSSKKSPKKSPKQSPAQNPPPQDLIESTDDEVDSHVEASPTKPSPRTASTKKAPPEESTDELDKENTPEELSPITTPPSKLVPLSDLNAFPKPGWSRPDASAKISKVAKGDDDWLSSSDEEDRDKYIVAAPSSSKPSVEALHAGASAAESSNSDSDDSDPALLLGKKKKSIGKPPKDVQVNTTGEGEGWIRNDKTAKTKTIEVQPYSLNRNGEKSKSKMRGPRLEWTHELEECFKKGLQKHDHLKQGAEPGMSVMRAIQSDPQFAHELRGLDEVKMRNKYRNMKALHGKEWYK